MTLAPPIHAPTAPREPREEIARPPRLRPRLTLRAVIALAFDLLLAAVAVGLGTTRYQEFLRMETLLVRGGKGFQLDLWSFPLPPFLHVGTALLVGEQAA